MWVLRARFFDEKNILSIILRKNKVKVYYYPSNHYMKNGRYYFVAIGIVEGEERSKKSYFKDLKNMNKFKSSRRLEHLEVEGDFFILITSHTIDKESKLYVSTAYDPELIHFKPVIWHSDGWEEISISCLDRKKLARLIEIGESVYKMELLEFKQREMKNFGFLNILPEFTERQKQAMQLAIDKGYYDYPRKTDLKSLAKQFKVAFSAFQTHIRKAEGKIIKSLFPKK